MDEKGVGGKGLHMGRTASVATAKVLHNLGTSKKGNELAQRMLAMFTNPKEHADYLTSPRYESARGCCDAWFPCVRCGCVVKRQMA